VAIMPGFASRGSSAIACGLVSAIGGAAVVDAVVGAVGAFVAVMLPLLVGGLVRTRIWGFGLCVGIYYGTR
jgi:hypothetical protein